MDKEKWNIYPRVRGDLGNIGSGRPGYYARRGCVHKAGRKVGVCSRDSSTGVQSDRTLGLWALKKKTPHITSVECHRTII